MDFEEEIARSEEAEWQRMMNIVAENPPPKCRFCSANMKLEACRRLVHMMWGCSTCSRGMSFALYKMRLGGDFSRPLTGYCEESAFEAIWRDREQRRQALIRQWRADQSTSDSEIAEMLLDDVVSRLRRRASGAAAG